MKFILLIALAAVQVVAGLKCLIKNENNQLVSQDFGSIAQACIYIKYPCTSWSSQDPYCVNQAAGSYAEVYSVWDDKDCTGFQDLASYYKDMVCCASNDCNNPSSAGFVDTVASAVNGGISAAGTVVNTGVNNVAANPALGGGFGRPSISDAQTNGVSWLSVAIAAIMTIFQLL